MPEITKDDRAAVANFIQQTFRAEDAQDYARIAVFLADEAQWKPAVFQLSRLLELEYWAKAYQGHANRLTGAIGALGRRLGFDGYENGVIMAGYTAEKVFVDYVKQGAFWKDAVSSNHGEHSHSIQWLAIALGQRDRTLGLQRTVAGLYKDSIKYKSNIEFGRPDGKSVIYLWDFLVDCFAHGQVNPDYRSNIVTQTARSPTYLNTQLQASTLWLGLHLKGRYDQRGWESPGGSTPTLIKGYAANKAQGKGYTQAHQSGEDNFVYEYKRSNVPAATVKPKPVVRDLVGDLIVTSGMSWNGGTGIPTATIHWESPSGKELKFNYPLNQLPSKAAGTRKVRFDMVVSSGVAQPTPGNLRF